MESTSHQVYYRALELYESSTLEQLTSWLDLHTNEKFKKTLTNPITPVEEVAVNEDILVSSSSVLFQAECSVCKLAISGESFTCQVCKAEYHKACKSECECQPKRKKQKNV
jgi:hypothetical protein